MCASRVVNMRLFRAHRDGQCCRLLQESLQVQSTRVQWTRAGGHSGWLALQTRTGLFAGNRTFPIDLQTAEQQSRVGTGPFLYGQLGLWKCLMEQFVLVLMLLLVLKMRIPPNLLATLETKQHLPSAYTQRENHNLQTYCH